MSDRVVAWILRGLWVVLPFTVWPAIGASLDHRSDAVRATAAVGAWAVWGVVAVATLVPSPLGLTALRCAAPAALAAAVAAVAGGRPSAPAAGIALVWSAIVTAAVLAPPTGRLCVNGPAYPNERRFPLAVPGALLLGPLPVAWLLLVGPPAAAALTLADRHWLLGGLLCVVAAPTAVVLARSLHRLSRRWVVFVPAGVVLHDAMCLAEPVLFRRQVIESLGPAPVGTDSLDLTVGAPGLALELRLTEKVPMARVRGRGAPEQGASARLLIAPTRPGKVLAYAAGQRVPIGTAGVG